VVVFSLRIFGQDLRLLYLILMEHISQYPNTFYRVSLKAVIRNDKNELLVVRENGHESFSLPGGGMDHGETDVECLKRELWEEVGYKGEITVRPFATEQLWLEHKQAWLLWIVYDVQVENYDFSVGADAEEIAFVDPAIFKDGTALAEQLVYKHCT
jgi:8-oxo-dGTP pyrophosphatase MutT (NUDIX family)